MTTRDLEQVVESALLDAGVSEERARAAAARLGDELVQLPTKADLDERFGESEQRWDERFRQSEQRANERFDALNQRMDDLRDFLTTPMRQVEQAQWRMTLFTITMWSATFGALMYAVFGA
ncbi:MAG: hypothetical protein OXT70_14250 [Chloroflexota bacterium]|nr:hypothetical protein [Chloroflexota bacterium]